MKITIFTTKEKEYIKEVYSREDLKNGFLNELAREMNRPKTSISRVAYKLGLTDRKRKGLTIEAFKNSSNGQKNVSLKVRMERVARGKQWHKTHEHPRGMLGKKQSKRAKMAVSKAHKGKRKSKEQIEKMLKTTFRRYGRYGGASLSKSPYSRTKGSRRKDLGNIYFRSAWEANYARFLNLIGEKWEFEPRTFFFKQIKRGTRSYTPDFWLPDKENWVEIKGWFDNKSKTRLKRWKKYYPEEFKKTIIVIQSKNSKVQAELMAIGFKHTQFEFYNEIENKVSGLIKEWE